VNEPRNTFESRLQQRAIRDRDFRQELLRDARGTVSRELGTALPDGVTIRVLQEDPSTYYIVLPPVPAEGEELSDEELESVAGGSYGLEHTAELCDPKWNG
jgi:hypothetical protein